MKKPIVLTFIGLAAALALLLVAFLLKKPEKPVTNETATEAAKETENETRLFSISSGGGYGTVIDTATVTTDVYTDGTLRVFFHAYEEEEIAVLKLSEEDRQKLLFLVQPENVKLIEAQENWDICDGSSSSIRFYDENNQEYLKLGGYCPSGEEYDQLLRSIDEVLEKYGIDERAEAYRQTLQLQ